MVLLNLIASLSLVAAVGVPAVVSFQSEIEESSASFVNRKNSSGFIGGYVYQALDVNFDGDYDLYFDGVLPRTEFVFDDSSTYTAGYGVSVDNFAQTIDCTLLLKGVNPSYSDLDMFIYDGSWHVVSAEETSEYPDVGIVGVHFTGSGNVNIQESYRVLVTADVTDMDWLNEYLKSKNIVPSITNGLGVVSNLASGLVGGFDSLALNDGALTNVMAFAFTLLGIGTAVGVAKLCFNWVTGRHGM